MYIYSPLDQFEIKSFLYINNGFYPLYISNYLIYLILILSLISLYLITLNKGYLPMTRWTLVIIVIYDTIFNMIKSQIGLKGYIYFPIIFTLFNFILLANLVSMIPYSFALTAQLTAIVGLTITLWLGNLIIGFNMHGLSFFSLFVPNGTPLVLVPVLVLIETISYTSRALSLGLRLSANVLSGHLLIFILGSLIINLMNTSFIGLIIGFIPILGVITIVILEFAISMIQAYVACILLSGYIKDSIYLH